jgi:alpha-methylacyl-CoA racemase
MADLRHGPLTGTRVVELGGIGPAPHTCMLLADLGADVLRIERPGMPPSIDTSPDHLNRNKRVLEADLKSASDRATVVRLLGRADVLVEGFRPGVAERLGLGPDELVAQNPRLVYVRVTGWGQDGPRSQRAGHDINYLSVTGALHAIGRPGSPPPPPLNLVADFGGGSMVAALGVLAALVERATTGLGQVVDAAMVDGVGALAQMTRAMINSGQWDGGRGGNLLDGGAPFYDTYACADGRYVAVGCIEPQFFAELLTTLGIEFAGADHFDPATWPPLRNALSEAFKARPRAHWEAVFADSDACVTPVLTFDEAIDDPHLRARASLVSTSSGPQSRPVPRFLAHEPPPPPLRARHVTANDAVRGWS